MNKFVLTLVLATAFVFMIGCGGGAANTTTTTNTTTTNTTANGANKTTTTTTTTETKTETASTGDKVGVPECDEYIEKYEACINSKVPENMRGTYKSSFETMRKSWKDAAANPNGKAALATGCKQALATAKQTFTAYNCAW